jgi:hypothetical protein
MLVGLYVDVHEFEDNLSDAHHELSPYDIIMSVVEEIFPRVSKYLLIIAKFCNNCFYLPFIISVFTSFCFKNGLLCVCAAKKIFWTKAKTTAHTRDPNQQA